MGESGKGAFANDFGLAEDFPEEFPDAGSEWEEGKGGVFASGVYELCDAADAPGKDKQRGCQ